MWLRTLLQIYQGTPGLQPGQKGWRTEDERWVAVKFNVIFIGPNNAPPGAAFYEFLGTMADNPVMGRYTITGTDRDDPRTNQVNQSYVIGNFAAPETKVWQYNPSTLTLQFGTLETWTGTPDSNNQNTQNITNDLELGGVFLGANGFRVRNGGFGNGFANKASFTHLPFERRTVWWTEI